MGQGMRTLAQGSYDRAYNGHQPTNYSEMMIAQRADPASSTATSSSGGRLADVPLMVSEYLVPEAFPAQLVSVFL